MRRLVFLLLVVATVAGCGMRRVENIQTPYVAREYAPYGRPGTARIAGGVAERGLAGSAMTCVGMDATLMPATALTREAVSIVRAGYVPSTRALDEDPALLRSTMKESVCDDEGNFVFDGLAAGT